MFILLGTFVLFSSRNPVVGVVMEASVIRVRQTVLINVYKYGNTTSCGISAAKFTLFWLLWCKELSFLTMSFKMGLFLLNFKKSTSVIAGMKMYLLLSRVKMYSLLLHVRKYPYFNSGTKLNLCYRWIFFFFFFNCSLLTLGMNCCSLLPLGVKSYSLISV